MGGWTRCSGWARRRSRPRAATGLTFEDELKQLAALRDASADHAVELVPTFLGAHTVPAEYKAHREKYVRLLIDRSSERWIESLRPAAVPWR